MTLQCTVCGEEYWPTARILLNDANALCTPCFFANFAGAQPPIDMWGPSARAALEEYVDAQGPYRLTPPQQEAMARLAEAWRRQEEGEA